MLTTAGVWCRKNESLSAKIMTLMMKLMTLVFAFAHLCQKFFVHLFPISFFFRENKTMNQKINPLDFSLIIPVIISANW